MSARADRARLSRVVAFCLAVWLTSRILIESIGWVVVAVHGVPQYSRSGPLGTFFNWDSGYFECIVKFGYFGPACLDGTTSARMAFFPGYPLLARALALAIGAGHLSATSVVTALWAVPTVASIFGAVLIYRIAETQESGAVARRATVLFVLGPYALFLVASYSESLYLAFAMGAWYLVLRRRFWLSGLVGLCATLTRVSGLFLVPALLVLYVVETRRQGRKLRLVEFIGVAVSGLGAAGYLLWLALRTGHLNAWFKAQGEGWDRRTQWPWLTLYRQGLHILFEPTFDWQAQAVLELVFAIGICAGFVLLIKRRNWPGAVLVGLTALSMMTSNTYLSLARNSLTLFPLTVLLAALLVRTRHRWLFWAAAAVGAVILVYNTVQFSLGHWAD